MTIPPGRRVIHATPLSIAEYAPYGGVISSDVVTSKTVIVNGGTARRTPEVVPTENGYGDAPSGIPGRTVLNASLASPRPVMAWRNGDGGEPEGGGGEKRVLTLTMLERHRFSTQSFVPMGAGVEYLVVVTDGDDEPNLNGLKAFVVRDGQGVCYGRAVWHAPMSVVGDQVSPKENNISKSALRFCHCSLSTRLLD